MLRLPLPARRIFWLNRISDDARCRAELRRYYQAFGQIKSTQAKQEDSVYAPYYDASEPLAKIPGHRVLALDRGEREGYLKVSITVDARARGGDHSLDVCPQKDRRRQRAARRGRGPRRLHPPDPPEP